MVILLFLSLVLCVVGLVGVMFAIADGDGELALGAVVCLFFSLVFGSIYKEEDGAKKANKPVACCCDCAKVKKQKKNK